MGVAYASREQEQVREKETGLEMKDIHLRAKTITDIPVDEVYEMHTTPWGRFDRKTTVVGEGRKTTVNMVRNPFFRSMSKRWGGEPSATSTPGLRSLFGSRTSSAPPPVDPPAEADLA